MQAVRSGAQDYLTKDEVNGQLLARAVRYAIERRRGDEALRLSEEKLRLAMEASESGILDLDVRTRMVTASADCQAMLGHEAVEVTGGLEEAWAAHIHPEDRAASLRALDDAIEGRSALLRARAPAASEGRRLGLGPRQGKRGRARRRRRASPSPDDVHEHHGAQGGRGSGHRERQPLRGAAAHRHRAAGELHPAPARGQGPGARHGHARRAQGRAGGRRLQRRLLRRRGTCRGAHRRRRRQGHPRGRPHGDGAHGCARVRDDRRLAGVRPQKDQPAAAPRAASLPADRSS